MTHALRRKHYKSSKVVAFEGQSANQSHLLMHFTGVITWHSHNVLFIAHMRISTCISQHKLYVLS